MVIEGFFDSAQVGQQTAAFGPCHASEDAVAVAAGANLGRDDFLHILKLLHAQTNHDCSQYKQSTLLRAIGTRMAELGVTSAHIYTSYLAKHPEEIQLLFSKLLISVTNFFRDPQAFATLKRYVLAQLLSPQQPGYTYRAWVPACATGEEAYSLAILSQEAIGEARRTCDFHIYATDIDKAAIAVARPGIYPLRIAHDMSAGRLKRFFTQKQHSYQVNASVRAKIVFSVQNVSRHLPICRFDLISCRNLMIYLEPGLQNSLMIAFHRALRPGGLLYLSPSESIGDATDLFTPVSRKWKLYRANSVGSAAGTCPPARSQASDPSFGGWSYET